jgi:hypothetical protein
LQPHKKRQRFLVQWGFFSKTDRFKVTGAEKPEQPFGCEDFEGEGQRRRSGIFEEKTE